ncbi:hypothetical protein WJ17_03690 [Burkholderia vietnamiensis]|nr:hypothetical protein WJ17_03690 [Burkholderia vietnamiensis]
MIAQAPDQAVTPTHPSGGSQSDFVFAVFTQMSQIQRDIGSLISAQQTLVDQVKESEARLTNLMQASELRITKGVQDAETRSAAHVDKAEQGLADRVKSIEDKVSTLRGRVDRVFWMAAGIAAVVTVIFTVGKLFGSEIAGLFGLHH